MPAMSAQELAVSGRESNRWASVRNALVVRALWSWGDDRLGVVLLLAALAAGGAIVIISPSAYALDLTYQILLWAYLGTAWNVIGGLGGQLSLGHAAFYGIGAYGAALTMLRTDLPTIVGVLMGAAGATVLGVIVGLASLRLRGAFFAMATFVLGIAIATVSVNFPDFTGGSAGLPLPIEQGAWYDLVFNDRRPYAIIALALFLLGSVTFWAIRYSKFGLRLISARVDVDAARAAGVNVFFVRVVAMAISAFMAAIAGSLSAVYILLVSPESSFSLDLSVQIVFIAIVGGIGRIAGPALGACVVVPIQQYVSTNAAGGLQGLPGLVTGGALFLVVAMASGGIYGGLQRIVRVTKSVSAWANDGLGGK